MVWGQSGKAPSSRNGGCDIIQKMAQRAATGRRAAATYQRTGDLMLQRVKFDNSPDEVLGDIYRELSKFIGDEYLRKGYPRKKELGTMTYDLGAQLPPQIFDKIVEFTKIRNNHVHEKKATKKQIEKSCLLYEDIRKWQNSKAFHRHKAERPQQEKRQPAALSARRPAFLHAGGARRGGRSFAIPTASLSIGGRRFLRAAEPAEEIKAPRRFHRGTDAQTPRSAEEASSDRALKFIGWFLAAVACTGTVSLTYILVRLL